MPPETDGVIGRGQWPMKVWRVLPGLAVLRAPVWPRHDLNGAPPMPADANLNAAIRAIRQDRALPQVIVAHAMIAEGACWEALQAMERAGEIRVTPIISWERSLLARSAAPDAEAYLAAAMSASTRKSLRRKRRALEELGPLRLVIGWGAPDMEAGFGIFSRLETAGWKGRNGTALAQEPAGEAHVRNVLAEKAIGQGAFTAVLLAGERPVAAGLFLRDEGDVRFWKTAYDETLARSSPGVVFDLMLTEWLYAQAWFERLDAGHDDSVDPATLIWSERQLMATVVIDLAPGSLKARGVAAWLRMRQRLRLWRNRRQAAK